MKCPACDFTQETSFETCPKCGVIVHKYLEKSGERAEVEERRKERQKEEQLKQQEIERKQLNQQIKAQSEGLKQQSPAEITVPVKYSALNFILWIVKIIAILPPLIGFFMMFGDLGPVEARVGGFALSCVWGVLLFASTESVQVFLDIEENQRKMLQVMSLK